MAVPLVNAVLRGAKQLFLWPERVNVGQVRSHYVNWRMLRDVKRRKMAFEYADERLRINALRKNIILPKEIQGAALGSCLFGLMVGPALDHTVLYWHFFQAVDLKDAKCTAFTDFLQQLQY